MKNKSFEPVLNFVRYLTQPVFVLLWTTITVYAVFIPLLGFYWDDLAIQWISEVYGTAGLAKYFSTNRPVWGLFYQLNTSLLGKEPWLWQVFGIFWRWVASVGLYFVLKEFWQGRKEPAMLGAVFFIIYPSFGGQFIATVFGHFFLVLSAYFFSLYFSLKALHSAERRTLHTVLALALSAVNVFSMEYFFMLELLRPILFFVYYIRQLGSWKTHIKPVLLKWLPYLALFLAAGFWRSFIFNYQTENYTPKLMVLLKTDFFAGVGELLLNILRDYWLTLLAAWGKVFSFPSIAEFGKTATLLSLGGAIALVILFLAVFSLNRPAEENQPDRKEALNAVILGLLAILPAGVPFWLTSLPLKLSFPNDRFSIPYIFGAVLFLCGIFYLLPLKRWLRLSLMVVLIAGAGALQMRSGVYFERDWATQSRFFWQLSWRMPGLEPNTTIYAQELPVTYFTDNSLTSTLNWIYDAEPGGDAIPYILFYPTVRVGDVFDALEPDLDFSHDLLIGTFSGNTSDAVAIYYNPPGCLRVLDPEIEGDNWMVSGQVREYIQLSDPSRILESGNLQLPDYLYAPEPSQNWCYFFQKADLARQYGDWETVAALGETAFSLDDNPNDPAERFPFIEGYAHIGNWQRALELSNETAAITPVIHSSLCNLWQRIETETEKSEVQTETLQTVFNQLECNEQ